MESISEQISLSEALSESHVVSLPKEWENKNMQWALAIVKVRKNNMSTNYAIAENDGSGRPIIIKDFGFSAKIVQIISIHPYAMLTNNYTPDLRNKQDMKRYLLANGHDEDEITNLFSLKKEDGEDKSEEEKSFDRELIKKMIVRAAVVSRINLIKDKNASRYGSEGKESENLF